MKAAGDEERSKGTSWRVHHS